MNKQFDEFKQQLNTIGGIYKKEFSSQKAIDRETYEKVGKRTQNRPQRNITCN